MLIGNFHPRHFLWVAFILVLVPTVVVYVLINRHVPESAQNSRLPYRAPVASFLVGILSAAAWLSWSPGSSIEEFFYMARLITSLNGRLLVAEFP